MDASADHQQDRPVRSSIFYQFGTWGAILIIGYFLLTEHFAHVVQVLPYLLLLACPLMHLFMHRGHGEHEHHNERETK